MEKNKVKLTICGAEYIIGSDEDSKYMIELGDEVDEKISTILKQNPRISVTQAAVLAALEFADSERKASADAENCAQVFRIISMMREITSSTMR